MQITYSFRVPAIDKFYCSLTTKLGWRRNIRVIIQHVEWGVSRKRKVLNNVKIKIVDIGHNFTFSILWQARIL